MQEEQSPKKLWLAVLLSLFPPPLCLGYAYLGLWRRWLNVFLYCLIAWFVTGVTPWSWDAAATFFLAWLFVLVDVQKQAKLVNLEVEAPNPANVDDLLAVPRESQREEASRYWARCALCGEPVNVQQAIPHKEAIQKNNPFDGEGRAMIVYYHERCCKRRERKHSRSIVYWAIVALVIVVTLWLVVKTLLWL